MKEHGLLFNPEMIRAIQDGRKHQTRRLIKVNSKNRWLLENGWADSYILNPDNYLIESCPIKVGDRIWVRETWAEPYYHSTNSECETPVYRANCDEDDSGERDGWWERDRGGAVHDRFIRGKIKWKPSIFMPRWASRYSAIVTDVQPQRLESISEDDAIAEGLPKDDQGFYFTHTTKPKNTYYNKSPRSIFWLLWDSINGKKATWASNPFVWRYTLEWEK